MNTNELHAALVDLADAAPDNPGRLTQVHRRVRRNRHRRVAVAGGSLVALMGAAAVGSGAMRGGGQPTESLSAGPILVSTAGTLPAVPSTGPWPSIGSVPKTGPVSEQSPCAPGTPAPGGLSGMFSPTWTGTAPAVGQSFTVDGVVSGTTSDTLIVTLTDGATGQLTVSSACDPPIARPGDIVHVEGTRVDQTTYKLTTLSIRLTHPRSAPPNASTNASTIAPPAA